MGLHLGWIPNEPGLRAREYAAQAPGAPDPDSPMAAALRAAHAARALWTRLLIVVGLLALALFGFVGAVSHRSWFWYAGAAIAVCCWLPLAEFAVNRRRANSRMRRESDEQLARHAAELAEYERSKAAWQNSEAERIAAAPRWLQVAAHEDISRLDVFGGTPLGRQNLLTGIGQRLLAERAVIVLDLTQDRVCGGLIAAAAQDGISCHDYQLPWDLPVTPLLTGLTGDEVANLIVEVLHADNASATAAGRATDLMILRKVTRVLGDSVTMARLHEALLLLVGSDHGGHYAAGHPVETLTEQERERLRGLFGDAMRGEVAGNLIRIAAVIEPLAELGAAAAGGGHAAARPPARLTCLSLPDGPRDVASDLTAALIVQWATRAVAAEGGFRPAVILAGADEQSTRHLGRLTSVCDRYQVPLVRMFSRLTEESARHLDSRHTAFMRLATRPEALRAAEHIGLARKFVAGRFSHRQSVSRSRTRTSTESTTHTTGRAEGEAVTHTTGTTTGQSYSEAEVPRHDNHVHIHAGDSGGGNGGSGTGRAHADQARDRAGRERAAEADAEPGRGGGRQSATGGTGGRRPESQGRSGGGWLSAGASSSGSAKAGKPAIDVVKTRTKFTAQHQSESKTQSVTNTQETSHTQSESRSRTDGTSVGDEITFELVYDHQVQPETLMALPEDQMLAPHVVAGAPDPASLPGAPNAACAPDAAAQSAAVASRPTTAESRMVALVIDPSVVGTDPVAPVSPHEIPAYEPPAPAVSSHVPDYERLHRPALGAGDPARSR
ncbi:MAG: hypothetical protein ABSA02_04135 [Trebonia sp.]|jgi:hypothetical protein